MDAVTTFRNRSRAVGRSRDIFRAQVTALLDRLVFRGILGVLFLSAIPYGTVQPWWVALFECCIFALTAVALIEGQLSKKWNLPNSLLLIFPAALILIAVMQTFPIAGITVSHDPYQTRLWILQFAALLLTATLLLRYTSTPPRLDSLVMIVIIIGALSAVFGLIRHLLNLDLQTFALLRNASYAQFINRNHFAMLMEMTLGLSAGIVVAGGIRRLYLPAFLLLIGLLWTALVLSNSRGGVLAMLGQALFVVLFWKVGRGLQAKAESLHHRPASRLRTLLVSSAARILLAVVLVATIGLGVIWLGGDSLRHRWEILPRELSAENASRDNSTRLAIWKATVLMIRDHPLVGVGFGGYRVSLPKYHDASGGWIPQEAHNEYLELMASGGMVAAVLMLGFIVLLIRYSRRCLLSASDPFKRAACFGAQVGLFGVFIHSFLDFGLHVTLNALVCIALIVIGTRPMHLAHDTVRFRPT